ncbi:MAG: ANTAR domain-containing protein [Ornithinibacter sp.]
MAETLELALEGRAVVEQTKGALAQVRGLDMGAAFDAPRAAASASGKPLGEAGRDVLDLARRGGLR